jgi:hypothetical protein
MPVNVSCYKFCKVIRFIQIWLALMSVERS